MNKKQLIATTAAILVTGSLLGARLTFAQESGNPMSTLVAKIAQKFDVDQAEVQSVFDEFQTEREQARQAETEAKLTQAVTDGTITESQKQAILSKIEEMHVNRPDPSTATQLTDAERQAEREARKTEMDTWLKENGLTMETFHKVTDMGRGKGMGGPGHGMRPMTEQEPSELPTE